MPKQTVPDMSFHHFALAEIPRLFTDNKIYVNEEYQRGDIWKHSQKIELLNSIIHRYSVGVLVLYINDSGQFEILDGQQRLLTILQYLNNDKSLDLTESGIQKYQELNFQEKTELDAYSVFYLKLKSHDPDSKEEDIVQTFLRLQEGTPLNKAEKINARRGKFKDTFKETRETQPIFKLLGKEKRFRWRQLSAEMLSIELEADFDRKIFPDIDLKSLIKISDKYKDRITIGRVNTYKANLDFLYKSLNIILTAFTARELISFYILVSYLRKKRAGNENFKNEISIFAKEFLKNLNKFSLYDEGPPKGMSRKLFNTYLRYKQQSKILTTSESLANRLEAMLEEFERMHPLILKDSKRLHDTEQKRILYFRQEGLCSECGKEMLFNISSSHHEIAHSDGGITDDLDHTKLMHEKCHARLENRLKKQTGQ